MTNAARARQAIGLAAAVFALPILHGDAAQRRDDAGDPGPLRFEDVTTDAGVDFHLRSGAPAKRYLIEVMTGGVALVDADADGWVDIYFVNGSTLDEHRRGERREGNRLFRNDGDGTFTDVTAQAGVAGRHWGMGVCAADVNGDGHEDLYVTNAGPNLLYLGRGDGTFRDASAASGADDPAWSAGCAFADADGDGDLDLYVANYLAYDLDDPPNRTDGGERCRFRGLPGVEVACGPLGLTPQADRYFENQGDATFRDATARAGMATVPPSYGLGVIWADYDDDGDQDLYVANDEMPNFLFRNDGTGTFTEVGLEAGAALSGNGRIQGGMGVEAGDVDGDGDLDLVVTNFVDDYNTLYRNEGNGAFTDATQSAALVPAALPYVGWGLALVDLDLDGDLDLPIANGHLYPQLDRSLSAQQPRSRDTGFGGFLGGVLDGFLEAPEPSGRGYLQRNQLFRNDGGGRFGDATGDADEGFRLGDAASSRGLAAGDLDNDGLVDLVVTHLDDAPSVLVNRSPPGNWLLLDLEGAAPNPSAIGARVTVRAGDLLLRRDVRSGGSYQSQHDRRLHFGLGGYVRADEIHIRWPSGRVDVRRNVDANRIVAISEP